MINTFPFFAFFPFIIQKILQGKLRNKLIILDNANSHRNEKIKELVNKHNNILYSVTYQYFTNSIENYFSILSILTLPRCLIPSSVI